jgi:hypothetical protein
MHYRLLSNAIKKKDKRARYPTRSMYIVDNFSLHFSYQNDGLSDFAPTVAYHES